MVLEDKVSTSKIIDRIVATLPSINILCQSRMFSVISHFKCINAASGKSADIPKKLRYPKLMRFSIRTYNKMAILIKMF